MILPFTAIFKYLQLHLGYEGREAVTAAIVGLQVPIMQRVLKPYLKGGGAQAFKNAAQLSWSLCLLPTKI